MMNKCRGRIVQEDYIMENIFHKKGRVEKLKGKRHEQSAWHWYFVQQIYIRVCLLGHKYLILYVRSSSILAVIQLINI